MYFHVFVSAACLGVLTARRVWSFWASGSEQQRAAYSMFAVDDVMTYEYHCSAHKIVGKRLEVCRAAWPEKWTGCKEEEIREKLGFDRKTRSFAAW